ncbi:uncharacterized protein [Oscarella lobularis]|uniref:uncharacterized protein n=1 Tax=Oscarella lobularis TaxID=121494 RepID=UPI003313F563
MENALCELNANALVPRDGGEASSRALVVPKSKQIRPIMATSRLAAFRERKEEQKRESYKGKKDRGDRQRPKESADKDRKTSSDEREKTFMGLKPNCKMLEVLTAQEIRDLRMVFDAFDVDSSQSVDDRELQRAMRILGFPISIVDARNMIDDLNCGQTIGFEEFLRFVTEKQGNDRDLHDEIMQGFHLFDKQKQGKITVEDLRLVCDEVGERMSDHELKEMINVADRDGDAAVSSKEFVEIMLRTNLFL